jgi:predicted small lipoprotein YifL
MKRIIALTTLSVGLLCFTGCSLKPASLPPNAINATDSSVNHVLQMAHSGAAQFDSDVVSGKFTPSAAEKSAYNSVAEALNVADPLYQKWHAALVSDPGAGEPQQLIDAAAIVTANINTILAAIGKVK